MVEKMKLLHITGPKYDIDRIMNEYLTKYEIHFENAMLNLENISNARPYIETNIYMEDYINSKELLQYLEPYYSKESEEMTPQDAREIIKNAYQQIAQILHHQQELVKRNNELKKFMEKLSTFQSLDFEFKKMLDFQFIKFRLGRIPIDYYHRLEKYIYKTPYALFYECYSDENYVWGVYFVPYIHVVEIDAVFLSFYFERIYMEGIFEGTPKEAYTGAEQELLHNQSEINNLAKEICGILTQSQRRIRIANQSLENYCQNFDIRKLAACTQSKSKGEYYILYGWMSQKDAQAFQKEIITDENIHCVEEEADGHIATSPPTRLKNPRVLKPFEMFVEMYGLPAYNEMDPTLFVALTYTLMFGIMFGDIGQGLCLTVGGLLLNHIKGMRLAGIISLAGVWSTFFGLLYGSVFGFEDIILPLWRRPMDDIMETLIVSIVFGGSLILIAMILNMINAIRAKEYGRLLFHQSGLAGMVCYGFVALCVVLYVTGKPLPATIIIGIVVGISLLAILLKEPLGHLIEQKGSVYGKESKTMFLVESLVELFDVILSYATNTISFVRVGAFALSHAGMMGVILTLSGMERGAPNWPVIILGNILVTGLEGLVVGIQVLRLEYYEMFSRFYKGSGKPFVAFQKK